MIYEIEVSARVYVSVEFGAQDAALRLARDHVCNDWLLKSIEGVAINAGHYLIKGLSAEATSVRPMVGNRRVAAAQPEEIF